MDSTEINNQKFQNEKSFINYLKLMSRLDGYVYIIAVKDTIGFHLGEDGIKVFSELGLNFNNKSNKNNSFHQCGYIAVIDEKKVLYENLTNRYEVADYSFDLFERKVDIISGPFYTSNIASIVIDGYEFATDERGINIVVWSKKTKDVIDSVSFDTHIVERKCKRKSEYVYARVMPREKNTMLIKGINDVRRRLNMQNILPKDFLVRQNSLKKIKVRFFYYGFHTLFNAIESVVCEFQNDDKYDVLFVLQHEPSEKFKQKLLESRINWIFREKYEVETDRPEIAIYNNKNYALCDSIQLQVSIPFALVNGIIGNISDEDYKKDIVNEDIVDLVLCEKNIINRLKSIKKKALWISTGNPKFDCIYNNVSKNVVAYPRGWERLDNKKVILWAFDHNWNINTATFDLYIKDILEIAETNNSVAFIIRPHPNYILEMKKNKIWNQESFNFFLHYLWMTKNVIWDESLDYGYAYSKADAVITDVDCGITISALPLDIPVAVFERPQGEKAIPQYPEIIDALYRIDSREKLESFINDVIEGRDPGKEERIKLKSDLISHFDGKNGSRIKEIIEREYKRKVESSILVDLHVHSSSSDGQYTPTELIKRASEEGISMIALTDHDTIAGNAEAKSVAEECGVRFIPGIEISCQDEEEIHIVGLNIDFNNVELIEKCREYKEARSNRAINIKEYLERKNIYVNIDEIKEIAGDGNIGRPHFAQWLVAKGIVASKKEAFDKYLDTIEFHNVVIREKPTTQYAIELIHKAGGKAVLAHPGLLNMNFDGQKALVERLVEQGLDAIECFYSKHSEMQVQTYVELAKAYGLKISSGSDFHGEDVKPDVMLGMKILSEYKESLVV